jgi:glyoxylase-like metal-dependent hydrolase (beta-lactamase superfamily II)
MSKKLYILLLLSISLWGFDYKLKSTQINDNTWCFLGKLEAPSKENGGFMSNSCYIDVGNSYVLIDSGATYELAKQAYEKMSQIKNLPVHTVINTHSHDDHWLGSSFYKEKFNAKILGPSTINSFKDGDKTRMFNTLSNDAIKNTYIIKLDKIINEITTLKIGNNEFAIVPVGIKAHTSDDLFVYNSTNKTIFSGDLIMNGRITSNRDGSVIGELEAINMIEKQNWDYLVPGHGFDTSKTALNEAKEYFTLLKKRVLTAVEDDVGLDKVTQVVTLDEFKDKKLFKELNKRNILGAYRELEFYEGN